MRSTILGIFVFTPLIISFFYLMYAATGVSVHYYDKSVNVSDIYIVKSGGIVPVTYAYIKSEDSTVYKIRVTDINPFKVPEIGSSVCLNLAEIHCRYCSTSRKTTVIGWEYGGCDESL